MTYCTNCGSPRVAGNRFCTGCGAQVPGATSPRPISPHPTHAVALGTTALSTGESVTSVFAPGADTGVESTGGTYRGGTDPLADQPPVLEGFGAANTRRSGEPITTDHSIGKDAEHPRFGGGDAPPSLAPAPGLRTTMPSKRYVLLLVGVLVAVAAATAFVLLRPSARLTLTTSQVEIGNSYFATASGFSPGENVQFSWTGPTNGVMGVSPVTPGGDCVWGPIIEEDPPGNYEIIATGLTSGHIATAALQVKR